MGMKRAKFEKGQTVLVVKRDENWIGWVSGMSVGRTHTVITIHFEKGREMAYLSDGYFYPASCLELKTSVKKSKPKKKPSTGKTLIQIIVNTKGHARTVTQERNEKGQFTGKARVGLLLNPTHIVHLAVSSKHDVVTVQHSFTGGNQTVSSVNRQTKKGNFVTFINDGRTGSLHDSVYGKGE